MTTGCEFEEVRDNINAEDVEKLVDYYSRVLQLATDRLEEYRAGDVPFPSVRLNPDTIIDFFQKNLWDRGEQKVRGLHNMNHLCLALAKEDWQELSKRPSHL